MTQLVEAAGTAPAAEPGGVLLEARGVSKVFPGVRR
jgi:hypothetical protein